MTKSVPVALRSASLGHEPGLRVLIVRVGAMGDVLHGMPAVAGLRAALPGAVIGWAIEPRWAPLLRSPAGEMPLIDRVHLVNTREWKKRAASIATTRAILALRRELRAERYDVCVDLQGSIRSAAIGWMAGAKRFVGPEEPRERQARWLYGERAPVAEANVIGQAAELVSAAVGAEMTPARVTLPVDAEAELWANRVGSGFVLLAPTAGWGAKEWGAARYGLLASGLLADGYRVLVNAAPGSRSPVAEEVTRASGAEIVRSDLPQMIALTRRAGLVIGGDTGPVHLAAALGRPAVALFGPTDPTRNGPAFPGAKVEILRNPASVTSLKRGAQTEAGLEKVRVEEVLAAALAMLQGKQG